MFPVVAKNISERKSSLGRFKRRLDTAEEKICAQKGKKCREKTWGNQIGVLVISSMAASELPNMCDCSPGGKGTIKIGERCQSYPRSSANLELDKRTPTNGYSNSQEKIQSHQAE